MPKTPIFSAFAAISLFAYILYRALHLSFVHDESLTYSILFGNKVFEESANNHLLNTAMMRYILTNTGRDDEGLLRLPNVLSFILYAFAAYKITARLPQNSLKICGYLLLLLNPFVLDFFSLARGYGLSLGLMMASIYFLLKIWDNPKAWLYHILFGVSSIGVVYANFTLLIFYLAAMLAWVAIGLYKGGFKLSFKLPPLSMLCLQTGIVTFHSVILYQILPFLFMLKNKGGLYAGGNKGMIKSLVESNIVCLFYEQEVVMPPFLLNSLVIVVILGFIAGIITMVLKIKKPDGTVLFPFLLVICCIIPFLQRELMGILYPIERTAVFYYPLWVLCVVFLGIDTIISPKIHRYAVGILTVLLVVNFTKTANLTHTHTWSYDAHSKEVMLSLKALKEEKKLSDTTKMGVTWLFEPSTKVYYRPKLQYSWLHITNITSSDLDSNSIQQYKLFYITEEEAAQNMFKSHYTTLKAYNDTKTVLLMRNN